jgi:hypothetical protein
MEQRLETGELCRPVVSGHIGEHIETDPAPQRGGNCTGCLEPLAPDLSDQVTGRCEDGRPLFLHNVCFKILNEL